MPAQHKIHDELQPGEHITVAEDTRAIVLMNADGRAHLYYADHDKGQTMLRLAKIAGDLAAQIMEDCATRAQSIDQ